MITKVEVVKKLGQETTHKKERETQLTYITRPVSQEKKETENRKMEFIH